MPARAEPRVTIAPAEYRAAYQHRAAALDGAVQDRLLVDRERLSAEMVTRVVFVEVQLRAHPGRVAPVGRDQVHRTRGIGNLLVRVHADLAEGQLERSVAHPPVTYAVSLRRPVSELGRTVHALDRIEILHAALPASAKNCRQDGLSMKHRRRWRRRKR